MQTLQSICETNIVAFFFHNDGKICLHIENEGFRHYPFTLGLEFICIVDRLWIILIFLPIIGNSVIIFLSVLLIFKINVV